MKKWLLVNLRNLALLTLMNMLIALLVAAGLYLVMDFELTFKNYSSVLVVIGAIYFFLALGAYNGNTERVGAMVYAQSVSLSTQEERMGIWQEERNSMFTSNMKLMLVGMTSWLVSLVFWF